MHALAMTPCKNVIWDTNLFDSHTIRTQASLVLLHSFSFVCVWVCVYEYEDWTQDLVLTREVLEPLNSMPGLLGVCSGALLSSRLPAAVDDVLHMCILKPGTLPTKTSLWLPLGRLTNVYIPCDFFLTLRGWVLFCFDFDHMLAKRKWTEITLASLGSLP